MDARQASLRGEGLDTDANMTDASVGLMSNSLPATSMNIAFLRSDEEVYHSSKKCSLLLHVWPLFIVSAGVTHASICNKEEGNTWEFRRFTFAQWVPRLVSLSSMLHIDQRELSPPLMASSSSFSSSSSSSSFFPLAALMDESMQQMKQRQRAGPSPLLRCRHLTASYTRCAALLLSLPGSRGAEQDQGREHLRQGKVLQGRPPRVWVEGDPFHVPAHAEDARNRG